MSSEVEKLVVRIAGEADQYTQVYNDAVAKAETAVTQIEEAAQDAALAQQVAMAEAAAVIAALTTPMEIYAQGVAKLDQLLEGGHLTQRQYNQALVMAANALPDVQREQAELNAELELAKRITTSVTTAEEEYHQKFNQLVTLLGKGRISQETYNRAVMELRNILPQTKAEEDRLAASEEYRMGLMNRGRQVTESVKTTQERYNEELNELIHLFGQGAITAEVYNRAIAKLAVEQNVVGEQLDQISNRLRSAGSAVQSFGRSWSMYVTAPLTAFGAGSVYAFASFDDAITKSTAIMSGVTDNLRKDMEEAALAISSVSDTGPTQVAESFYFLASASFDAAGSIRVLDDVERFATAGHFDMAKATEMLADATSALGLKSNDAAVQEMNLVRVSDVLTEAANRSNASVEQFAKSLTSKSAAAMRMMGIEVEEGVAVLAAYADQGVKGEMAGEKFTIMLRELQNAAQENKEVWKSMNLQVFDAQGNFLKIADIIAQFETKMDGLTDSQKNQIFAMLGFRAESKDAISSLIGLSGKINEYEDNLNAAGGTTKNVAEKQLKSFTSEMKILWNQIQIVGIEIGRILVPILQDMTSYVREAISWWKELTDGQKSFAVMVGIVAAAIGPMLVALGTMGTVAASLVNTYSTLSTALKAAESGFTVAGIAGTAFAAMLVAVLIVALRAAVEEFTGFNASMEKSIQLTNELINARAGGNSKEIADILDLPKEQQQAELQAALARANQAYESYAEKQDKIKKKLKEYDKIWFGKTDEGIPIAHAIKMAKAELDEAGQAAKQAQGHAAALEAQLKAVGKVGKGPGTGLGDNTDFEHQAKLVSESKKIIEDTLTPMQKFEKQKAMLDEMLNAKEPLLTLEQYNQALEKYKKNLDKSDKEGNKAEKIVQDLENQVEMHGKSKAALKALELQQAGATPAQVAAAEAAADELKRLEDREDLEKEHKRMLEKSLTPQEKLAKAEEKIHEMRKEGIIKTLEEENKLIEAARKEMQKDLHIKVDTKGLDTVLKGTAEFEDRFEKYLSLREDAVNPPIGNLPVAANPAAIAAGAAVAGDPADAKKEDTHESRVEELLRQIAENTKSDAIIKGIDVSPLNLQAAGAVA